MLRKIALTIIAFSLALSACSNPHYFPVPNSTIFFTFRGKENWEIWKVNRNGTQSKIIYEIPRKLSIYSAQQQIITPKIATELKDKPFLIKEDEVLETSIGDIHLSPNQKMLSWQELVLWCPGNYCIGQFAIRVLNLDNNQIIASYATTNTIDSMVSWSPDSKYVAFDQTNKWQLDELSGSISLFDVTNLESKQIGRGYYPDFAKDNNKVIAYILNEDGRSSCCQIINLPSGKIEEFSFDRKFGYIDLSPDGNKLVAMSEEENLIYPNIIDLRSKQITKLDAPFDNRYLIETKWSPNGKSFAVKEAFPFQLTILNTMGDTQLKIEDNVQSWAWAENSDEIIFIKRNKANGCNAIDPYIYFGTISSGEIFKMDFPLSIKNRLTNKNLYDCHNDLFGEITW